MTRSPISKMKVHCFERHPESADVKSTEAGGLAGRQARKEGEVGHEQLDATWWDPRS